MKKCEAWVSDDGAFRSFHTSEVRAYEAKIAAKCRLEESMTSCGSISYGVDLYNFLDSNADDIRLVMGWEQITF